MEQVEQLLRGRAVDELHRLVWAKPRVNRGEFDAGWSCREHAASIAALLTLEGVRVRLRHGRCMFVQGAAADAPPVAIGQELSGRAGHTWVWADGFGDLDVSPRLRDRLGRWRPIDAPFGIVGTSWPVAGLFTDTVVCNMKVDYDNAIALATHMRDAGRAVYLVEREEPFDPSVLVNGETYLNSPLTARITALAGPAVYVKLVVHLRGLLAGQRRSLATVSFGRGWRLIGEIPDQAANGLIEDLEAALANKPDP